MANKKTGFNYWSVETDRYLDRKIKRLKKEFKGTGIAVYDYICNEIYRDKGCYMEWDEGTTFDVAEYWDIKESHVTEIVNYCCYVGLFDKGLLASGRLLSSKGILERWLSWSKLANRTEVIIPEKLKILRQESEILPEEYEDYSADLPGSKVTEPNLTEPNFSGEKPPGKKKVVGDTNLFWKPFVAAFENFYTGKTKQKYEYRGQDWKGLDGIYKFLKKRGEAGKFEFNEENLLAAFQFFLEKAWTKDNWLKDNFSISNLLSQINQIANGQSASKNGSEPTGSNVSTSSIFSKIAGMPDPAGVAGQGKR